MASASEVKAGLDQIALSIRNARASVAGAISAASAASTDLDSLPTTFGDVIATVQGYGDEDAFEAVAKAELAKLTAEFVALKGASDGIAGTSLGG